MDGFDEDPPWWVGQASIGGFGGAAGIGFYKALTGEGRDAPNLLVAALILVVLVWYIVAVARWRQEHRIPEDQP